MSADHADVSTAAITSFVIALCPDPECKPGEYMLCDDCRAVLDASYPEKCTDPNCYPCTRGTAGAER